MGSSFPTNKGVQKSGLTWKPRGDSWTLRDHAFHGMELSRLLCTIFPCHSSPLTLDVCHFAGKDAQLLQHRAVPAKLLPLGFTSRPLGARHSCKKSPCMQTAGLIPAEISLPKLEPPIPDLSELPPTPASSGLCSRAVPGPWEGAGERGRALGRPGAGSGQALNGLRLPPCVLPQNCSAGCRATPGGAPCAPVSTHPESCTPGQPPTWGALPPAASWGQHGGEVWGARAAASTLSFITASPEPAAPLCWSIPSPAEPFRSDRCLRVPKPGFGNTLRALRLQPRPYPADPAPCHRGAAEVLWERTAAGAPLAVQCAAPGLGGVGGSPQQPPGRRGVGSTRRQP